MSRLVCLVLINAVLSGDNLSGLFAQDESNAIRGVVLKDGTLRGRISTKTNTGSVVPTGRLQMKLIRRGQIKATALTSASGEFEFHGIGPGKYSLTGAGRNGFLAIGVNILDEQDAVGNEGSNSVDALAIPPRYTTLGRIISRQTTLRRPRSLGFGQSALTRGLIATTESKATPTNRTPLFRFANTTTAANTRNEQIYLEPDGSLRGRVYSSDGAAINFSSFHAFAIQNDQLVAETALDPNGRFEFADFQSGVYGFVISGHQGLAAVQGEVRPAADFQTKTHRRRPELKLATLRQDPDEEEIPEPQDFSFELSLMSPEDLQAFLDSLPPELRAQLGQELGLPVGDGLVGQDLTGFGAFPGSTSGTGDLLARLLGAGGLATGIVALATDRTSPD